MKFRPVRLGMMTSALALEAVLLTAAGAAVVGFIPPSAAGGFNHSSKKKNGEGVITETKYAELRASL